MYPTSGKLSGLISERDYVTKIALLGKTVSVLTLLDIYFVYCFDWSKRLT